MSFKINFVFIALCLHYHAMAGSVEELKLKYVKYILECVKEHPVSMEEIKTMSQQKLPETENLKCLLACSYKKSGMTDAEGKLSIEGIKKISEEAFADSPELMKKSELFTKACLPVNDADVSGDKKECERAAMIYKCSLENSASIV